MIIPPVQVSLNAWLKIILKQTNACISRDIITYIWDVFKKLNFIRSSMQTVNSSNQPAFILLSIHLQKATGNLSSFSGFFPLLRQFYSYSQPHIRHAVVQGEEGGAIIAHKKKAIYSKSPCALPSSYPASAQSLVWRVYNSHQYQLPEHGTILPSCRCNFNPVLPGFLSSLFFGLQQRKDGRKGCACVCKGIVYCPLPLLLLL